METTRKTGKRGLWPRRVALPVALAGLMACGTVATSPAGIALAATGTITITQSHNTGATYDGYRIFKADVDSDDNATNIAWDDASVTATKTAAVLGYLDSNGYGAWLTTEGHISGTYDASNATMKAQHDLAQNAADFMAAKIDDSAEDTDAATTPKTTRGTSFASGLARALVASSAAKTVSEQAAGTPYTGDQGYYLFVTTGSTIGDLEAGTAPIWVAVSAKAGGKTISEKSAVPTLTKQVKEDSTGGWGSVADANRNQDIEYRLEGTVAQNVNAFHTYYYQFVDTMTGLDASTSDVTVTVGGTNKTDSFEKSFSDGTLTVTCDDLLGLGVTITKDTKVVVEYKAHLNADAVIGGTGNPNTAYVRYSSNPAIDTNPSDAGTTNPDSVPNSTDKTQEVAAKAYTFQLELEKVDQETREALANVQFSVQVHSSDNTDAASKGKYVQSDGTLGTNQHFFTTGNNGKLTVPAIDEGVYTLHEEEAPTGHTALAGDITLTVTREYNSSGVLTDLHAVATGGNGLFQTSPSSVQDGIAGATTSDGKISLRVSNKRESYLPGTGLTTSQAGMILGTVCVALGLVGIVRYRKRGSGDGEE